MSHTTTNGTMRSALLLVALALLSTTAWAHHGWTGYEEKAQTITGTIRESAYENPHASVRLQADGDKGKTWVVVLAPPGRMGTRGLTKESIKVGTAATVAGYVHKTNSAEMRAERITIAGKTIELR